MSQNALHPMLNTAIKAARGAGSIINRASLDIESVGISVKGPRDFVTEVDRRCEEHIIETLLTAYPSHGILAEESGREHGQNDSEFLWIIDPLDGTTNFIHGFPVYAVSIALAFKGQVQQAVVYDPARNDLFFASKGRGAYLNNRRLRVSKRVRMGDALIGTGFPFRRGDNFQRYLQMFEKVAQSCAGLRRPGAAALDLCYVAAGWYDGFFETGLSPWDMAAGSLMVTEAGGLVGNFTGEPDYLFQRELVCGNPRIYGQLVQMLAPFTTVVAEPTVVKAAPSGGTLHTPEAALAGAVRADAAGRSEPEAGDAAGTPGQEPVRRKAVRIPRAVAEANAAAQAPAPLALASAARKRARPDAVVPAPLPPDTRFQEAAEALEALEARQASVDETEAQPVDEFLESKGRPQPASREARTAVDGQDGDEAFDDLDDDHGDDLGDDLDKDSDDLADEPSASGRRGAVRHDDDAPF